MRLHGCHGCADVSYFICWCLICAGKKMREICTKLLAKLNIKFSAIAIFCHFLPRLQVISGSQTSLLQLSDICRRPHFQILLWRSCCKLTTSSLSIWLNGRSPTNIPSDFYHLDLLKTSKDWWCWAELIRILKDKNVTEAISDIMMGLYFTPHFYYHNFPWIINLNFKVKFLHQSHNFTIHLKV